MAGDLVLSQDVDSGELTYRPVLSTTIRPPSPVRRIRVGDEVITATAGHPFWVAGHGWQMAKFLRAGDLIHGLAGSWPIQSADEAGEQEAYNLVVGDFHSYFVGEHGLLVHDNQLRQPTRAILPGYRPDVQERDAEGGTDHRRQNGTCNTRSLSRGSGRKRRRNAVVSNRRCFRPAAVRGEAVVNGAQPKRNGPNEPRPGVFSLRRKGLQWHVDTDRFLFSPDPHELASMALTFEWEKARPWLPAASRGATRLPGTQLARHSEIPVPHPIAPSNPRNP